MVHLGTEVLRCIPLKCGGPEAKTKSWAEIDAEAVRATCDQVIPHLC